MRTCPLIGLLFGALLALGNLVSSRAGHAIGGEPSNNLITVDVSSGRTFTAALDPLTDRGTLWLRWTRGSASIRQPISWDRVVRVHIGDKTLAGVDFAKTIKTPQPNDNGRRSGLQQSQSAPGVGANLERTRKSTPSGSETTTSRASPGGGHDPGRIRSLAIDAQVANWNSTVEMDGLVIDLRPLDAEGALAPARGTLEVSLIGSRATTSRPGRAFSEIGRWTQRVEVADFHGGGATYRFAFQQAHPEFDPALSPSGAVHVRLSVPGQGVFEATTAAVRIRPHHPIRDQFQQSTGQRFFPQERVAVGGH